MATLMFEGLLLVAAFIALCAWWDHLVEKRHYQDVQRYIDPRE